VVAITGSAADQPGGAGQFTGTVDVADAGATVTIPTARPRSGSAIVQSNGAGEQRHLNSGSNSLTPRSAISRQPRHQQRGDLYASTTGPTLTENLAFRHRVVGH